MSKPTPERILAEANALVERNAKRDRLYDRLDALYFMDNTPAPAEGVQHVTMPYATSVVDLVVDLAAQMEFAISVPAAGESLDDERAAEALEAWLRAWLAQNAIKQQRNLIGEAAFLATQRAQSVARTLFVDESIKLPSTADAEATIAGLPVIFQLRDPRYVYAADGPLGPRAVVEQWSRLVADVRALYPNALPEDVDDDQEVTWTEWWTDKYRCYFVNGEPVKVKGGPVVAHGYGCLPYAFGNGRTTPFRGGERRYRPLLAAVETLASVIDVNSSIQATAGLAAVTNAWAVYSDQFLGDSAKDLDLNPGAVNYLATTDKIQALQRAAMPPDFAQWSAQALQAFQQNTFPFAIFGQSPGDMAGYAISLLSQAGRRVLLPVWHAIESMLAGAFLNCVTICANKVAPLVGKQIPLVIVTQETPSARQVKRKLRLDVTKYGADLDISVKLADPMPADQAGALRMAIEATGAKLLSHETALEKFKLSSEPQTEAERIVTEELFRQLAPLEMVKLMQQRGDLPQKITLPEGFAAGPDGQLIPQAILDSIQGAQQAEQAPPAAAPMPQGEPDPAMLQQMMAQMQQGVTPAPVGTGEPTGRADIMALNALAGQPISETLIDEAGGEPSLPYRPGGF